MDKLVKIPVAVRNGEDAITYLVSLPTENPMAFKDETTGNNRFGTVDEYGRVYIKKHIADELLIARGIVVRDFMRWARENEFVRYDNGHYSMLKRLRGENKVFRCVCISAKIIEQEASNHDRPEQAGTDAAGL